MSTVEYRPDMPMWQVLDDWRDSNPRLRSKETIRLMESSLRRFEEYMGRPTTLADMTEQNVTGFMRHREAQGKAACTIEREGNKVTTLWRWAAKRDWTREPLLSIRKAAPRTPEAWKPPEMRRLIRAAEAYPSEFKGYIGTPPVFVRIPGGLVMGLLVPMLLETGERLNALTQVKFSDVDMATRFMVVRSQYRKGKIDDNLVQFSRRTLRTLKRLMALYESHGIINHVGTIFPEKKHGNYHYHFRRVLATAGVPYHKGVGFHQIRRTHATALYLAGGDPTLSLRHESAKMTRDHYLDPRYVRPFQSVDYIRGGIGFLFRRMVRRVKLAFGIW